MLMIVFYKGEPYVFAIVHVHDHMSQNHKALSIRPQERKTGNMMDEVILHNQGLLIVFGIVWLLSDRCMYVRQCVT